MTSRSLIIPPDLATRRSEAAHKAWATRRAQGWAPRSAVTSAPSRDAAIDAALARFEQEASSAMPDWHGAALELKAAVAKRRALVIDQPAAPRLAPPPKLADYEVDRASNMRLQWPSPILVVTFADGVTIRAPAVSLLRKPVNVGRGLRVAVAFYQNRICHQIGLKNLPGTRPAVPDIVSCLCEDTGEEYNADLCSAHTAPARVAQDWKMRRIGEKR